MPTEASAGPSAPDAARRECVELLTALAALLEVPAVPYAHHQHQQQPHNSAASAFGATASPRAPSDVSASAAAMDAYPPASGAVVVADVVSLGEQRVDYRRVVAAAQAKIAYDAAHGPPAHATS